MAQRVNESIDLGGAAHIIGLPAPAGGTEPARKTDLDAAIATLNSALAGFSFVETPAAAAATANVNIAAPGAAIDGYAPVAGDQQDGLVLLTAQTNNHENGLWVWNGAAIAMTRPTAGYTYKPGTVVVVGPLGGANKNSLWIQTTDEPVVDTTALTFTQFGSSLSAGTGLQLVGNVLSLLTPVAVANGGTGGGSASAARGNLGAPGVFSADFGDGAATAFPIAHGLGNAYPQVQIYNKATGAKEDCAVTSNTANQVTLSAEAWAATPPAAGAYRVVVVG